MQDLFRAESSERPDGDHDGVSRRTLVRQIMDRVKQLIASGQYGPGDRLPTEQALAERFGVGRSSIREAIKVFQYLGVVDTQAGRGTIVRERANISVEAITWALLLGERDLEDVMELREAIESRCFARLAAAIRGGNESALQTVEALKSEVERMAAAGARGDVDEVVEADYRFHGLVIEGADNHLFAEMYRTLQSFMREEIATSYQEMSSLTEVAADHREIINALEHQLPHAAQRRHSLHFERIRRLLGMPLQSVGTDSAGDIEDGELKG